MAKVEIVGFGAMNIDHLIQVDELVIEGEQLVMGSASYPGGSAANTIYGLAKLGIKTGFVGAVGNDETGKRLIDDFKSAGIDINQLVVRKSATGSTICLSDKMGRRAIYVSPGANSLLNPKDIDAAYFKQAQIAHMSSFADDRQLILQVSLTEELKDSVRVSLAPGMLYVAKGLKALTPLLRKAYIVFMNRNEIECLTGKDFQAGASHLIKLGCQVVVVTLGKGLARGKAGVVIAYIRDVEKEYEIVSRERSSGRLLETTGAGDAFSAGFIFGLIKGKTIAECGLLGDIMAGFTIEGPGARTVLPSISQLSQRYYKRSGHRL